jgi:hypothetical protein
MQNNNAEDKKHIHMSLTIVAINAHALASLIATFTSKSNGKLLQQLTSPPKSEVSL